DLLGSFGLFLTIAIAFAIPWTSINLVDFYIIRRHRYSTYEILRPNGFYGNVSFRGLTSYFVGFLVQLPFMDNDLYEGYIAKMLNADISWLVGAVISGLVYLWLMWSQRSSVTPNLDTEILSAADIDDVTT